MLMNMRLANLEKILEPTVARLAGSESKCIECLKISSSLSEVHYLTRLLVDRQKNDSPSKISW
jgi:hypothetical protein